MARWIDTKDGRRRDAMYGLRIALVGSAILATARVFGPASLWVGSAVIAAAIARTVWAFGHGTVSGVVTDPHSSPGARDVERRKCAQCGHSCPGSGVFCDNCGAALA